MKLKKSDSEIYDAIVAEKDRQFFNLELIASENYVSGAVLESAGSILTNKYAEGYPQKRYYGGCKNVDDIETLAIERVKKLFGAKFANVQPHSGSQANMAALFTLAKPGDRILGQSLQSGGHLSHGSKVSFSGQIFESFTYGISKKTGLLDYNEILKIAKKVKPKVIICGFSAYPRKIDFQEFRKIADEVGAYLVADIAHIAGLVATGFHQSPIGIADIVTTTTHKTLRGPRGGVIMTNNTELAAKIDKAVFPGIQGGPLENIIAAKAVCFKEALDPKFKEYIGQVIGNMRVLSDTLHHLDFDLVTKGSDNHLTLIDLCNKEITGVDFEIALEAAGITVNKNSVPGDDKPPSITSGIRVGTAAVTTRGMGPAEMQRIAEMINIVAENMDDDKKMLEVNKEVREMCKKFPI
ncbi:serine hydroxymethyltransferase [Candidatus Berkelbacteria bacterium CG08_land_8_20_14_0_20_39_8]|uniref:Serine hydroxymethyltransferase n=1 Tax=Candidatus Berkelbacteria bacterium CG08_land_8_20_14_0_20_39_8 TaxID=1974511 RepID=A0A2M6YC70_9BACT|nr:MAG: serine hydroxymethyltransferase [Candidatus Berkelbacteria bacterium CG08_land_8_20_14_0_20_39_8]